MVSCFSYILIFSSVLIENGFSNSIVPIGFYEDPRFPFVTPDVRISGGKETQPNEFPWQVAVFTKYPHGEFICGGSVISAHYILTAAHCTLGGQEIEILLGAHNRSDSTEVSQNLRILSPANWAVHEEYNSRSLSNDISYIKLDTPIQFNEYIQPIPLNDVEPNVGQRVIISGWGVTNEKGKRMPTTLHKTTVLTAEDYLCSRYYSGCLPDMANVVCLQTKYFDKITRSSCGGDSGGPMNYKRDTGGTYSLNGITSFGSSEGCEVGAPVGYTSIPAYLDWIEKNTGIIPPALK